MLKRLLLVTLLCGLAGAATAEATTIYPIDRAAILAGTRFDFKVEFDEVIDAGAVRVTIGRPASRCSAIPTTSSRRPEGPCR